MTTPTHTPEQWAEILESLARNKALPSLWPEDCFAIAALLRAQADALAEQEAEVGRLREALRWYADETNLHALNGETHMRLIDGGPFRTPDKGFTARVALTPTQEAQK